MKMDIIFYPPKNEINDYIKLIISGLESNGVNVINKLISNDFSLFMRAIFTKNRPKIMHLNWIEDNASKKGIKSHIKCFALLCFFRLYKKLGGKIVWTLHNAKSHDINSQDQRRFIKKFLKLVDLVVIHTKESYSILDSYNYEHTKILYVPIGNYDTTIHNYLTFPKEYKEHKKMNFFYFGTIAPYKGIPRLIQVFNDSYIKENANLLIWGKPNKDMNINELMSLVRGNDSIIAHFKYIDTEALCEEFNNTDIAIFPFNKESMQNSGSIIMALTCATPVLVPLFGYIKDIKSKDFVFSYDYELVDEHTIKLKNKIIEVIDLWKKDPNYFVDLGNKARRFAVDELDWNQITSKIADKYNSILKEEKRC